MWRYLTTGICGDWAVLATLLVMSLGCVSSGVDNVRLFKVDDAPTQEFQELGRVEVRRRVGTSTRVAAEQECWQRLRRRAADLGATAVLLELPILTEEGSAHGGMKLVEIQCRGIAIKIAAPNGVGSGDSGAPAGAC